MAQPTKARPEDDDWAARVVAPNIRKVRKRAGRTQQQLSDQIGWSQGWISQIECGRRMLSVPELRRIATGLGVTVERLVRESEGDTGRQGLRKP